MGDLLFLSSEVVGISSQQWGSIAYRETSEYVRGTRGVVLYSSVDGGRNTCWKERESGAIGTARGWEQFREGDRESKIGQRGHSVSTVCRGGWVVGWPLRSMLSVLSSSGCEYGRRRSGE